MLIYEGGGAGIKGWIKNLLPPPVIFPPKRRETLKSEFIHQYSSFIP